MVICTLHGILLSCVQPNLAFSPLRLRVIAWLRHVARHQPASRTTQQGDKSVPASLLTACRSSTQRHGNTHLAPNRSHSQCAGVPQTLLCATMLPGRPAVQEDHNWQFKFLAKLRSFQQRHEAPPHHHTGVLQTLLCANMLPDQATAVLNQRLPSFLAHKLLEHHRQITLTICGCAADAAVRQHAAGPGGVTRRLNCRLLGVNNLLAAS